MRKDDGLLLGAHSRAGGHHRPVAVLAIGNVRHDFFPRLLVEVPVDEGGERLVRGECGVFHRIHLPDSRLAPPPKSPVGLEGRVGGIPSAGAISTGRSPWVRRSSISVRLMPARSRALRSLLRSLSMRLYVFLASMWSVPAISATFWAPQKRILRIRRSSG